MLFNELLFLTIDVLHNLGVRDECHRNAKQVISEHWILRSIHRWITFLTFVLIEQSLKEGSQRWLDCDLFSLLKLCIHSHYGT